MLTVTFTCEMSWGLTFNTVWPHSQWQQCGNNEGTKTITYGGPKRGGETGWSMHGAGGGELSQREGG